jgi:hypothetical protein
MLAGSFLESGATNEALITPAGYAFGLWGVITALSAVTAAAVVRYGLGAWWETSLLVDASVVFVGFSVWLLVAAQDWLWVSVVVFMVMVAALIHIVRLLVLRRHELTCPSWLTVLAAVTFGLYLGWSSIAVFANVAAALINSGVPASVAWWQFIVLVLAGIFVLALTRLFRATPGFVAGVLWALLAIAIGAAQRAARSCRRRASVTAVLVAVLAVSASFRRRRAG